MRRATVVLPGAGVAGEAHVQRGARGHEPRLAAEPVDHEQRRDLADPRLDGRERDEVGVELCEHVFDPVVLADGRRGGLQLCRVHCAAPLRVARPLAA